MTQCINQQSIRCLADGSAPATAVDVEHRLRELGIAHSTTWHPPMFTVADSRAQRYGVPGGYSKNLFLRNKKGHMWLVTLLEDREVNLRALGEAIGAGRVSFGSPERLMKYLGVIPGAVTPLAVINDTAGVVQTVIDRGLLERSPVHFHPCDNTATTTLAPDDLLTYMRRCGHEPSIIAPDAFSRSAC